MGLAVRVAAVVLVSGLVLGEENRRFQFLQANLDAFPGADQLFEQDEKLFWRLRAGLKGIAVAERVPGGPEYPFRVTTDGAGRRRVEDRAGARRRILFLGDSCTFGIPVNDGESFPAVVQRKLGDAQCLNAGVPGYSAFQGRLLLKGIGERVDTVVITFWVNDRSSWDNLSDPEHEELMAAERAGEFSRYRVLRLLRRVGTSPRPRLTEEEFAGELRAMVELARKRGANPVLVVWPAKPQMKEERAMGHQEAIRKVAKETQSGLVDLVPVFRSGKGEGLFVDSVHATREGYEVAGSAVAEFLKR